MIEADQDKLRELLVSTEEKLSQFLSPVESVGHAQDTKDDGEEQYEGIDLRGYKKEDLFPPVPPAEKSIEYLSQSYQAPRPQILQPEVTVEVPSSTEPVLEVPPPAEKSIEYLSQPTPQKQPSLPEVQNVIQPKTETSSETETEKITEVEKVVERPFERERQEPFGIEKLVQALSIPQSELVGDPEIFPSLEDLDPNAPKVPSQLLPSLWDFMPESQTPSSLAPAAPSVIDSDLWQEETDASKKVEDLFGGQTGLHSFAEKLGKAIGEELGKQLIDFLPAGEVLPDQSTKVTEVKTPSQEDTMVDWLTSGGKPSGEDGLLKMLLGGSDPVSPDNEQSGSACCDRLLVVAQDILSGTDEQLLILTDILGAIGGIGGGGKDEEDEEEEEEEEESLMDRLGAAISAIEEKASGIAQDDSGGKGIETAGALTAQFGKMIPAIGGVVGVAGKFVEVFGKTLGKVWEWNELLRQQNFKFAEYSGAMARVKAETEVREMHYEKERGDERAASTKFREEAFGELKSTFAPVTDVISNGFNYVVGGITKVVSGIGKLIGLGSGTDDTTRRADFATTVTTDARTALVDLAGRGDGYEWPLM